ncbi:unnamed protein product [Amoebophrya sp. A120]|nr:unnamed protein product [Amoebophrya sp. A120]|eukprot:GSA120T00019763001.1
MTQMNKPPSSSSCTKAAASSSAEDMETLRRLFVPNPIKFEFDLQHFLHYRDVIRDLHAEVVRKLLPSVVDDRTSTPKNTNSSTSWSSAASRLEGNCLCTFDRKKKAFYLQENNVAIVRENLWQLCRQDTLKLSGGRSDGQDQNEAAAGAAKRSPSPCKTFKINSVLEIGFNAGHSCALFCHAWSMRAQEAAPADNLLGGKEINASHKQVQVEAQTAAVRELAAVERQGTAGARPRCASASKNAHLALAAAAPGEVDVDVTEHEDEQTNKKVHPLVLVTEAEHRTNKPTKSHEQNNRVDHDEEGNTRGQEEQEEFQFVYLAFDLCEHLYTRPCFDVLQKKYFCGPTGSVSQQEKQKLQENLATRSSSSGEPTIAEASTSTTTSASALTSTATSKGCGGVFQKNIFLHLVEGDSRDTVPQFGFDSADSGNLQPGCSMSTSIGGTKVTLFDLIHVDGSHSSETTKQDILNCRRFAKPLKTILVVDDAQFQGIREVLEELIAARVLVELGFDRIRCGTSLLTSSTAIGPRVTSEMTRISCDKMLERKGNVLKKTHLHRIFHYL